MTIDEIKELMETGEEFEIEGLGFRKFTFMDGILFDKANASKKWDSADVEVNYLLSSTLIRKPWKPKVGEDCYWWAIFSGSWQVTTDNFTADELDLQAIAFGNCFRTKEECEKHTEMRDKLIEIRKEYV